LDFSKSDLTIAGAYNDEHSNWCRRKVRHNVTNFFLDSFLSIGYTAHAFEIKYLCKSWRLENPLQQHGVQRAGGSNPLAPTNLK
jgi:hypothetical protein